MHFASTRVTGLKVFPTIGLPGEYEDPSSLKEKEWRGVPLK